MRKAKQLKNGKLEGMIYDFTNKGDVLEAHLHKKGTAHISIVARGSFRVWGEDWEITTKAGDVLDFVTNQLHGFEALEADSRVVNIIK